MRSLELAKVAAAAEALRVKRLARRQVIRVGMAVGGLVFGLAAFAILHALAYVLLRDVVAPWLAVLIVLVVDLVVAAVLAGLALSSKPDRIEREALAVRRESLAGAKKSLTVMAVAGELGGLVLSRKVRQTMRRPGLGRALMVADIVGRVLRRR